jgi:Sulfotransferase family
VVVVSEAHSFVFVSNGKAASTSVEAALSQYQDRSDLNEHERPGYYTKRHMPAIELISILGAERWMRYTSFAIVREPFAWFLSQVSYNVFNKRDLTIDVTAPLTADDIAKCYDFLRKYRTQEASPSATQWAHVCDQDGQLLVSALWRLEGLAARWPQICRLLNIREESLPNLNRSESGTGAIPRLAPSGTAAVRELYAMDCDLYDDAPP